MERQSHLAGGSSHLVNCGRKPSKVRGRGGSDGTCSQSGPKLPKLRPIMESMQPPMVLQ